MLNVSVCPVWTWSISRESGCKTFQNHINIQSKEFLAREWETRYMSNWTLQDRRQHFPKPRPNSSRIHPKTTENRSLEGVWAPIAAKVAFQADFGSILGATLGPTFRITRGSSQKCSPLFCCVGFFSDFSRGPLGYPIDPGRNPMGYPS